MAGDKLVGTSAASPTNVFGGTTVVFASRFQAVKSGDSAFFRIYANTSATVKLAVYDGSGGPPGSLVYGDNTARSVVSGWNEVTFEGAPISSGTYYWLAARQSVTNTIVYHADGAVYLATASLSFASAWPGTLSWGAPSLGYDLLYAVHEAEPVVVGTIGGILPNI